MFEKPSTQSSLSKFCLQCVDCLQVFHKKKDADNHKAKKECTKKILEGAICSGCNAVFEKVDQCLQHMQHCDKLAQGQKYRCSLCKKLFISQRSCLTHMKSKCSRGPIVFQCQNCCLEFTKKCALIRHINQNACTNPKNQKCFVDGCDTYFRKNEHLAEHIEKVHDNNIVFEGSGKKWEVDSLKFTSRNEFQQWLIRVSNEYNCNYFTSVVKKMNNVIYANYKCQYDKKSHNEVDGRKSLPNLKCPSQICCKSVGGYVSVTYYKTHSHEPMDLKRHCIDYSRKMRAPSETVQHFLENTNFSDDVLQMETDSYVNISNDNVNTSNKPLSNNIISNEDTYIGESEYSEIQNENDENSTENTPLERTCVVQDELKETLVHSVDRSKNIEDNENSRKQDTNSCKEDRNVQYCNRILKHDISELFTNILEYVESTDSSSLLIQVKSQLSSVLNECIKDKELSDG